MQLLEMGERTAEGIHFDKAEFRNFSRGHLKTDLTGCHRVQDFRVSTQIARPFVHSDESENMDQHSR